jgi:hypothetical protein
MYNLVIQSFGNEKEYRRAILTILSFFAHTLTCSDLIRIFLFTDNNEYFKIRINDVRIFYIDLTGNMIRDMRGNIDFLHRMKIAIIEESFKRSGGNLIYADSDTFFILNPLELADKLSEKVSFMHQWEYYFSELESLPLPSGEIFRLFFKQTVLKTFTLPDGSSITILPGMSSWNAGVMMLHSDHVKFLPAVYSLTDEFYSLSKIHASEQYAFSIILGVNTSIHPCNSINYHYWYRVEKQIIDQFLEKNIDDDFSKLAMNQKIEKALYWTKQLPGFINHHILLIRDRAIQAFNEDKFRDGYLNALKAFLKNPVDFKFLMDVLYHTQRHIFHK